MQGSGKSVASSLSAQSILEYIHGYWIIGDILQFRIKFEIWMVSYSIEV